MNKENKDQTVSLLTKLSMEKDPPPQENTQHIFKCICIIESEKKKTTGRKQKLQGGEGVTAKSHSAGYDSLLKKKNNKKKKSKASHQRRR